MDGLIELVNGLGLWADAGLAGIVGVIIVKVVNFAKSRKLFQNYDKATPGFPLAFGLAALLGVAAAFTVLNHVPHEFFLLILGDLKSLELPPELIAKIQNGQSLGAGATVLFGVLYGLAVVGGRDGVKAFGKKRKKKS